MNGDKPTEPARLGRGLQAAVFAVTAAAYIQIYLTQPVLPVIQSEFGVSPWAASLTVALVIGGIAVGQVFWGWLADRWGIRPIIALGAGFLAVCGLVAAMSQSIELLAIARLGQGLFIPAVSTCLAAFLAGSLEPQRLAVVMGAYVSATVAGGLMSRLLGGLGHWALGWRWSFVIAAGLILLAAGVLLRILPRTSPAPRPDEEQPGYFDLLGRAELLRVYGTAMGAFFVFAAIFNYLPFYLAAEPFNASTPVITATYLSFLLGIVAGPLAGRVAGAVGVGLTICLGTVILGASMLLSLVQSPWAVGVSLAGVCFGFFGVHGAATGGLNQRLTASRGRANSLYVMFYYIAGYLGVTVGGWAFEAWSWAGVVWLGLAMLVAPLSLGLVEMRLRRAGREAT